MVNKSALNWAALAAGPSRTIAVLCGFVKVDLLDDFDLELHQFEIDGSTIGRGYGLRARLCCLHFAFPSGLSKKKALSLSGRGSVSGGPSRYCASCPNLRSEFLIFLPRGCLQSNSHPRELPYNAAELTLTQKPQTMQSTPSSLYQDLTSPEVARRERARSRVSTIYWPYVHSWASKNLRDKSQIDDVTQEVLVRFLVLLERRGLTPRVRTGQLRKLLTTIAERTSAHLHRKLKRIEFVENPEDLNTPLGEATDRFVARIEVQELVQEILDSLENVDPLDRRIFLERFLEDLKPKEIAERHDMSPGLVYSKVYRVKVRIKAELKNRGIEDLDDE